MALWFLCCPSFWGLGGGRWRAWSWWLVALASWLGLETRGGWPLLMKKEAGRVVVEGLC